jgi:branched-subunit amino acid transport protein
VTWLVILAVGAGSFLFRLGPLLVLHRIALPESADRVIRYAGCAAVTALITLSARGTATGDATLPTLLALAAGVVMAVRQATMFRVLVAGLAAYASTAVLAQLVR